VEFVVWWLHIQVQSEQPYVGVSCMLVGCEHQYNIKMFTDVSDLNKA